MGEKSIWPAFDVEDADSSHVTRTTTAHAAAAVGLPDPKMMPRRAVRKVQALPLDPAAAFLLEHIDGKTSVQDLVDLGVLPRFATLDAICTLRELGVIIFV